MTSCDNDLLSLSTLKVYFAGISINKPQDNRIKKLSMPAIIAKQNGQGSRRRPIDKMAFIEIPCFYNISDCAISICLTVSADVPWGFFCV